MTFSCSVAALALQPGGTWAGSRPLRAPTVRMAPGRGDRLLDELVQIENSGRMAASRRTFFAVGVGGAVGVIIGINLADKPGAYQDMQRSLAEEAERGITAKSLEIADQQAQLDLLEAQTADAEAGVELAEAQLELLQSDPTAEIDTLLPPLPEPSPWEQELWAQAEAAEKRAAKAELELKNFKSDSTLVRPTIALPDFVTTAPSEVVRNIVIAGLAAVTLGEGIALLLASGQILSLKKQFKVAGSDTHAREQYIASVKAAQAETNDAIHQLNLRAEDIEHITTELTSLEGELAAARTQAKM
eukprot:scaffold188197_cov23-Tisochrysis_lutea.AAC.1